MLTPVSRSGITTVLSFLLVAAVSTAGFAQQHYLSDTTVIKIDPYSHRSPTAVPFDHTFILSLPVDSGSKMDNFTSFQLYLFDKHDVPKDWVVYSADDLPRFGRVDTSQKGPYAALRLFIRRQLPPGAKFGMDLYYRITDDLQRKLNAINYKILTGDPSAEGDYYDLALAQKVRFSNTAIKWPPFKKGDDDEAYNPLAKDHPYLEFFEHRLKADYEIITSQDRTYDGILDALHRLLADPKFGTGNFFRCNCAGDLVANELFADSSKFIIPLFNLQRLAQALPEFAEGRLNIQEFEPIKPEPDSAIDLRLKNLQRLQESLRNISYFFHLSTYAGQLSQDERLLIYNQVFDVLRAVAKRQDAIKKAAGEIKKRTSDNLFLLGGSRSFGATKPEGQDIKTASGNYIIPDLGLTNFLTFVGHRPQYAIRPYIGVNISFRPLDKSVPLPNIENRKGIHWSAVIGLTTYQMTREGTSDLFKSMSLLAGVAYRWSRGFRTTAGILVYRRNSENPVLQQVYTVGPQVSLALDLDIVSWISKLTDKVY